MRCSLRTAGPCSPGCRPRSEGAREVADGIAFAPPDVTLVDVGVRVDEERKDDTLGHGDLGRVREVGDSGGRDRRDPALIDQNVDGRESFEIKRPRRRNKRVAKHTRLFQRVASGAGEGKRGGHPGLAFDRA